MIEIDKNIPPPVNRKRFGQPWRDMEPGDSAFFPGLAPARMQHIVRETKRLKKIAGDATPTTNLPMQPMDEKEFRKLRSKLTAKAHTCWGVGSYSVRETVENGVRGFRVWRKS